MVLSRIIMLPKIKHCVFKEFGKTGDDFYKADKGGRLPEA